MRDRQLIAAGGDVQRKWPSAEEVVCAGMIVRRNGLQFRGGAGYGRVAGIRDDSLDAYGVLGQRRKCEGGGKQQNGRSGCNRRA